MGERYTAGDGTPLVDGAPLVEVLSQVVKRYTAGERCPLTGGKVVPSLVVERCPLRW